jgi:hypothetical protein
MAEEPNTSTPPAGDQTPPVVTTPPTGNDPKPTVNGENNQPNNDEKFIPKTRFDEVNKGYQELKAWKAEQEAKEKAAEEESLKKKGEFEKLATQKDQEATQAREELKAERVNNSIILEAAKVGNIVDLDAVKAFIDRSKIIVDSNGVITGVNEALTALLESKPYLKGSGQTPSMGSGTNPPDGGQGNGTPTKFKASQIQDPVFYKEHRDEILKAMRSGQIEDDVP